MAVWLVVDAIYLWLYQKLHLPPVAINASGMSKLNIFRGVVR